MAHFLVVQEKNELMPVCQALAGRHDITIARNADELLRKCNDACFDMIISAVFFENADIFSLLSAAKNHPRLKDTPFVCFSARRSRQARMLNSTVASAASSCGADAFLCLDDFCQEQCNYTAIREAIEQQLHRA